VNGSLTRLAHDLLVVYGFAVSNFGTPSLLSPRGLSQYNSSHAPALSAPVSGDQSRGPHIRSDPTGGTMNQYLVILTAVCVLSVAECRASDPNSQIVTVLFNEAAVEIEEALVDGQQLWVATEQVQKINGFDPRPEGFCSADVCIPIPKSVDWRMQHNGNEYFNVTRFAAKVDQAVAVAESKAVWSFGTVPILSTGHLPSGIAPDFELPDREGNLVKLSSFRGKKVLILTWSSW